MSSEADLLPIPPILDPVLLEAVMALARSAGIYRRLYLITADEMGLDKIAGSMTVNDRVLFEIATIVTGAWTAHLGLRTTRRPEPALASA